MPVLCSTIRSKEEIIAHTPIRKQMCSGDFPFQIFILTPIRRELAVIVVYSKGWSGYLKWDDYVLLYRVMCKNAIVMAFINDKGVAI
ncbi:MAG: hypothetical protein LBR68_05680 [Lachnoclostridium sp.]|nr:hypothetical protein [Lachnoclostridium sp.]